MMVMGMETSVILVEESLATLMAMLVQLQSSHFLHKYHSNALYIIGRCDIRWQWKFVNKKNFMIKV